MSLEATKAANEAKKRRQETERQERNKRILKETKDVNKPRN